MYFIWRPQAETVWKQTEYRSPVMGGTNYQKQPKVRLLQTTS